MTGEIGGDKLTRVVGPADSDVFSELVVNINIASALDAEFLVGRVGQAEFTTGAGDSTNGLAGRPLGRGPLRLLVTGGTSVRAHGTFSTLLSWFSVSCPADGATTKFDVLNTSPATESEPVNIDRTVLRGERGAVHFPIGEVCVETFSTRTGPAGAPI